MTSRSGRSDKPRLCFEPVEPLKIGVRAAIDSQAELIALAGRYGRTQIVGCSPDARHRSDAGETRFLNAIH